LNGLADIDAKHKVIAHVRGLGLMCGVDVINRRTGKGDVKLRERILREAFQRGLILLPCGEHSIRFCPPLCINETQLDVGLKLFDEAVATVV
jgi:4-aminobutyrate aminotransferase